MKTESELFHPFEDESVTLKSAEKQIQKFESDCMELIYSASDISYQLARYMKLKDIYDEDLNLLEMQEIKEWVSDFKKALLKEWLNKLINSLMIQLKILSDDMNKKEDEL